LRPHQIQLVAEKLLDNEQVIVHPGDLDEPWHTLYRRIRPLDDAWLGDRAMIEGELWRATASPPCSRGPPLPVSPVRVILVGGRRSKCPSAQ
jgi:hypothetical protein